MILKHIYLYPDLVEFAARKDELLTIRDQTRHICNYLERQLVPLKFEADGFGRICIVGSSNPGDMYINTSHVLSVPVFFDLDACLSVPLGFRDDYYVQLLNTGFRRCASKYRIPLNELLGWSEDLKRNGYRNEWTHKERMFRQFGIKCQLNCLLTQDAFTLRLVVTNKTGNTLHDRVILTTPPDEIAFQHRFKDVAIEGERLVVTTRLYGEEQRLLYSVDLSEFAA